MNSNKLLTEPDIHISIVSHNHWYLIKNIFRDLDSLESKNRFQVTLTLNVPETESVDLSSFSFPIKIINNSSPQGFGDNHNQAFYSSVRLKSRHYFFVINPDVRIKEDVFSVLANNLQLNPEIGVIAPLVKNYSGEIEDSCRDIPTPWRIVKKFFGVREVNKCLNNQVSFESDWAAGMFLGFRSEVYDLLEGFDTRYFLYYEDVELCSRVWLKNYIVLINPVVSIIHDGQRESHRNIKYFQWHLKSMGRFFLSSSYHHAKALHSDSSLRIVNECKTQVLQQSPQNLPKISLITVSFNRQETIEDTILSVKSQTYKNLEYLIIDGASTDDTRKIIEKYPDVVTRYTSEPDKGIYDAMNKGIAKASGDIIGFINADDVLASSKVLSAVANAFAANNIDACYSDLVYVDQFDVNRVKRYWRSSMYKTGLFSKGWSPPHPTFYVKKSIYEKLGSFSLVYKLGNDIEIMLRFLEKYKIRSLYVPGVWVKMRMGGVSNESFANIVLQNREIIKAAKDNDLSFNVPKFVFFKLKNRLGQYFFK